MKNNVRNSLMSIAGKILIGKRVLIEAVNDELMNIAQVEHSRHRSFNNFIVMHSLLLPFIASLKRNPQLM